MTSRRTQQPPPGGERDCGRAARKRRKI